MKGKCSGGKSLGISLNFRTPEEFFAYLDKQCAHCNKCGKHEYKSNLNEMGIDPVTGITYYMCDTCNKF